MKSIFKVFMVMALSGAVLTACAPSISPNTYSSTGVTQASQVISGRIVSARVVSVSGNSLLGSVVGGTAGAVAGSTIGHGSGSALAAIGGALVGGLAGNYTEKALTQQQGMEYVVRADKSGRLFSLVQGLQPQFYPGQHVLVQFGERPRLIAYPG